VRAALFSRKGKRRNCPGGWGGDILTFSLTKKKEKGKKDHPKTVCRREGERWRAAKFIRRPYSFPRKGREGKTGAPLWKKGDIGGEVSGKSFRRGGDLFGTFVLLN